MALWHFLDAAGEGMSWAEDGVVVSSFDDGLEFLPNEEGFSREAADTKAAQIGGSAQYTGTPTWHDRIDREAAAAEEARLAAEARANAEAEISAMLNPVTPEDAQKAVINSKFDALLAAAPDRADDIEKLRKTAIGAIAGKE